MEYSTVVGKRHSLGTQKWLRGVCVCVYIYTHISISNDAYRYIA